MTTQRPKVLKRDGYRCRICPDTREAPHCKLHVHHKIPRAEGGTNSLRNLLTVCDLCHSVLHAHMGPWAHGVNLKTLPPDQREEKEAEFAWLRQEYQSFITLPLAKQRRIRRILFNVR
jgi:hypothetical protein